MRRHRPPRAEPGEGRPLSVLGVQMQTTSSAADTLERPCCFGLPKDRSTNAVIAGVGKFHVSFAPCSHSLVWVVLSKYSRTGFRCGLTLRLSHVKNSCFEITPRFYLRGLNQHMQLSHGVSLLIRPPLLWLGGELSPFPASCTWIRCRVCRK